jgi:hypothetical protein
VWLEELGKFKKSVQYKNTKSEDIWLEINVHKTKYMKTSQKWKSIIYYNNVTSVSEVAGTISSSA